MHFDEIKSSLTGISCPIFGVSWNPPEAERTVARRAMSFLEDRRVLYVDSELEVPQHCVESVLRIREYLTDEIGRLGERSELAASLRALRAAARKFLDTVSEGDRDFIVFGARPGHYASWTFMSALGEMRGVFGVQLALLATAYGLDIEDDLARILPASDSG